VISEFQDPEKMIALLQQKPFDYVIDAIDSITPKVHLIKTALEMGHRLVSSMGAGGKMDPNSIKSARYIQNLPLSNGILPCAKRLKEVGIKKGFKAVFSTELPDKRSIMRTDGTNFKKSAYGTISYIPAVFGMTCASVVIRDLTDWKEIK
jgi:tRNA A37 threonylcarbamoyladenosine dehydratase